MSCKTIALLAAILFAAAILTGCAGEPLRLHIVANSGSSADQNIKYVIRDEILKFSEKEMENIQTKEEAQEYIRTHCRKIYQ
jgi:hypothetical protein